MQGGTGRRIIYNPGQVPHVLGGISITSYMETLPSDICPPPRLLQTPLFRLIKTTHQDGSTTLVLHFNLSRSRLPDLV
jgi:hypothetical protein